MSLSTGSVGILNVAGGDLRLSFDPKNPAEAIRSGRVVKDMIRRGYALLVEVDRNGVKAFERALDFREDIGEYIIADFAPEPAYKETARVSELLTNKYLEEATPNGESSEETEPTKDTAKEVKQAKRGRKSLPAYSTRAVAVSRSAGG